MNKGITSLFVFILLGCSHSDPTPQKSVVEKVVFHDSFISDYVATVRFQYKQGMVQTATWNYNSASQGFDLSNFEERYYSTQGNLDSLRSSTPSGSKWNLSYEYKNGLRYKIVSKRNNQMTTTTFTEYEGTNPVSVENLHSVYGSFGPYTPDNTTFKFDTAGNLISQKNTGDNWSEEKTTTFGSELNPLEGLLETPFPQALEYFDDVAFYFSHNLPLSVEADYPYADPVYNRINFEFEKDNQGRVIHIKALSPRDNSVRYILDIFYN